MTSRPDTPKERLKLTLATPATPTRVRQAITMFEEALRFVDPELREEGITIVVTNFNTGVEVRGWQAPAQQAIRQTINLVASPIETIQEHANLGLAAVAIAKQLEALCPFEASFWAARKKIKQADATFVKALRAAGESVLLPKHAMLESAEEKAHFLGETVVFSQILRVGRRLEHTGLQARILLDGQLTDVPVAEQLEDIVWDVAKTGQVTPLRLQGRWVRGDAHSMRLDKPMIISVDATFSLATGLEILEEIEEDPHIFDGFDFKGILDRVQAEREE